MPEAGNILSDEFVVDLRRLLEWFARQPAGASLNAGGMPPRERWPDNLTWIGQGVLVDPANRSDPDTGDALPVYTDARYCFDLVRCSSADGDARGLPAFAAVTDDAAISGGTATNLAELAAGTHNLAVGTYVQVFRLFDAGDPAKKRYYFSAAAAAAGWGKATTTWTDAAGNGSYVTLTPCASATDGTATGEPALNVTLPRYTPGADPNVRQDQIIPYVLDRNGAAFCPANSCDGTKLKTLQLWVGAVADIATQRPGWQLCDGTNGTPDLTGRFIMGVDPDGRADEDGLADIGGFRWHGLTENNHNDHADHVHDGQWDNVGYLLSDATKRTTGARAQAAVNEYANTPLTLRHGGDGAGFNGVPAETNEQPATRDTDNRPRFYVLAFIMRVN